MRRFRSFTPQSPAIAISVAALILSLGGGAYAATMTNGRAVQPAATIGTGLQSRAAGTVLPQASRVVFNNLRLVNRWKAGGAPGSGNNGAPGYAVSGGFVYLRGAFHGGVGADFATLPPAARPAHTLWIAIVSLGPSFGSLRIQANGLMSAFGSTGFESLAGVSFLRNS